VTFLSLAVQKVPKLKSEENGFLKSIKIDGARKSSLPQMRSERRFVPSIFHADDFLHSQDPNRSLGVICMPTVHLALGASEQYGRSGSPALRRPLAKTARSFDRRNGVRSLSVDTRKLGSVFSIRAIILCACPSCPASALLAAKAQSASMKFGFSRIAFSAHDQVAS
jgi:hypothetical protein